MLWSFLKDTGPTIFLELYVIVASEFDGAEFGSEVWFPRDLVGDAT
jgi:hypothetical protein